MRRSILYGVVIGIGLGAAFLVAGWVGVALYVAGILAAHVGRP